jgi:folate-binding Fe-S cluster repair protein YgfZ
MKVTSFPKRNLDDAVSFTKGCYVGQEIIVRIKHRGHPAKKLTRLRSRDRSADRAGRRDSIHRKSRDRAGDFSGYVAEVGKDRAGVCSL